MVIGVFGRLATIDESPRWPTILSPCKRAWNTVKAALLVRTTRTRSRGVYERIVLGATGADWPWQANRAERVSVASTLRERRELDAFTCTQRPDVTEMSCSLPIRGGCPIRAPLPRCSQ